MEDEEVRTIPYSLYFGENQFPIVVRRMAGRARPVPEHDHEFSELVIVTKGTIDHEIDGETERLSRGDFFILHPGKSHSYPKASRDAELYNVLYDAKVPIPLLALSGFTATAEETAEQKEMLTSELKFRKQEAVYRGIQSWILNSATTVVRGRNQE